MSVILTGTFSLILTCSAQSRQLCYKNSFVDGYYQYGCGSTSIGEAVSYRWPGDNPDVTIDFFYTGGAFKEKSATNRPTIKAVSSSSDSQDITTTSARPGESSEQPPTSRATTEPLSPGSSAAGSTIPGTGTGVPLQNSPTSSSSGTDSSNVAGTPSTGQKGGLSTGAMIAIGVAAGVVAIITVALIAFCCYRRRKQRKDSHFLSTPADGGAQYDQPIMGTRTPAELYQGLPVKKQEAQHHPMPMRDDPQYARESGYTNSITPSYEPAPSYEPVRQASPQSPLSTATFPTGSPHPSSMAPTPNMPQYPQMYELPTNRTVRIPELDNCEARVGAHASHGRG